MERENENRARAESFSGVSMWYAASFFFRRQLFIATNAISIRALAPTIRLCVARCRGMENVRRYRYSLDSRIRRGGRTANGNREIASSSVFRG